MATQAQQDANQRNAQNSTGPNTEEGKNRSRRNACKHGLSSDGPVSQELRQKAADARKVGLHLEFKPETPFKAVLVDQLADASARLEICASNLNNSLNRHSRRAPFAWDDDRTLEAVSLTSKLSKQPEVIILQIKKTLQGCDHLISRWTTLAQLLDPQTGWSPELRSQALDMLGVEHAHRAGLTVLDPPVGCDLVAHLRDVIAREVEAIERKISAHLDDDDAQDQAEAAAGTNALLDRNVQLMLRYHTTAFGQMMRLLGEIRRKPNQKKALHNPGLAMLQKMNAEATQTKNTEPSWVDDLNRREAKQRAREEMQASMKRASKVAAAPISRETKPISAAPAPISRETKPIPAAPALAQAPKPASRWRPGIIRLTIPTGPGSREARRSLARQLTIKKR